jgi:AcrR family transcriptional regulator
MEAVPTRDEEPPPARERLPRGKHNLPRTVVASNQRGRIVAALAVVCAAKGYRAATVKDIITQAGVSRRTFYDLFADKQDCFLLAYELMMERVLSTVEATYAEGERPWPERIGSGLRALLELLAAEPVFARLVLVEVLAAGRVALERRDVALQRFEAFFIAGRTLLPAGMRAHEQLARAIVGGLTETLYTRVLAGQTAQLPELGPDLLYCVLVPYVGHAQALAAASSLRV